MAALSPTTEPLDGMRLSPTAPGVELGTPNSAARTLANPSAEDSAPGAALLKDVDSQMRRENLRWALRFWLYPPRIP